MHVKVLILEAYKEEIEVLIFCHNLTNLEIKDLKELMTSLTRVHLSTFVLDARHGNYPL